MDQEILIVFFYNVRCYALLIMLYYSMLTHYKQFGTNSKIVLMFVESQRVHI
jgi:hypothetical protein